jgi:hypothetical protein
VPRSISALGLVVGVVCGTLWSPACGSAVPREAPRHRATQPDGAVQASERMLFLRHAFAGIPALGTSCVLSMGREVYCRSVERGQETFTRVPGLTEIRALAAGRYAYCGLHLDGTVSCWGCIVAKGDDASLCFDEPRRLRLPEPVVELRMARQSVFMVTSRGTLYWLGKYGSLMSAEPARVGVEHGVSKIEATGDRICILDGLGAITCLADSMTGVELVPSSQKASQLVAGTTHFCALFAQQGTVRCWGSNSYGQLGSLERLTNEWHPPQQVVGLEGATKLWSTADVTCALTGELICWGQPGESGIDSIEDAGKKPSSDALLRCSGSKEPACSGVSQLRTLKFSRPVIDAVMTSEEACVALDSDRILCSVGLGPGWPDDVTKFWDFIEVGRKSQVK